MDIPVDAGIGGIKVTSQRAGGFGERAEVVSGRCVTEKQKDNTSSTESRFFDQLSRVGRYTKSAKAKAKVAGEMP